MQLRFHETGSTVRVTTSRGLFRGRFIREGHGQWSVSLLVLDPNDFFNSYRINEQVSSLAEAKRIAQERIHA